MSSNLLIIKYKEDFARQSNRLELLKKYFSDSILTGGGKIDDKQSKLINGKNEAHIYFTEPGVAQRVADRKTIPMGTFSFDVELGKANIVIRRPILIDGNNVGIQ